ncbi:CHRD domain-containing protein [Noviherbaspirillum malthae]|jgi:hypothetical protein|uniref:CHRD domain-containing protein n=1 Tax=Noviherbaspirillum malthae TaxID=1260987 RepID=UPI0018901759|nr:CHRD domain-containing protein [Noviherbaspirillum malthae]
MIRQSVGVACAALVFAAGNAWADNGGNSGPASQFSASLSGFNEVPLAIFSQGNGKLELSIDEGGGSLNYTLSYSGLTSPVTQAHIHFGQRHVAGGIMMFFCSNLGNGPAGTQACPEGEGTVSGTIMANQVVGPEPQNIQPGDFAALVKAIRSGTGYANVHTTKFPSGEIRGQVHRQ